MNSVQNLVFSIDIKILQTKFILFFLFATFLHGLIALTNYHLFIKCVLELTH